MEVQQHSWVSLVASMQAAHGCTHAHTCMHACMHARMHAAACCPQHHKPPTCWRRRTSCAAPAACGSTRPRWSCARHTPPAAAQAGRPAAGTGTCARVVRRWGVGVRVGVVWGGWDGRAAARTARTAAAWRRCGCPQHTGPVCPPVGARRHQDSAPQHGCSCVKAGGGLLQP